MDNCVFTSMLHSLHFVFQASNVITRYRCLAAVMFTVTQFCSELCPAFVTSEFWRPCFLTYMTLWEQRSTHEQVRTHIGVIYVGPTPAQTQVRPCLKIVPVHMLVSILWIQALVHLCPSHAVTCDCSAVHKKYFVEITHTHTHTRR